MRATLLDYVEVSRSAVLLSAEHGRDVGDGVTRRASASGYATVAT